MTHWDGRESHRETKGRQQNRDHERDQGETPKARRGRHPRRDHGRHFGHPWSMGERPCHPFSLSLPTSLSMAFLTASSHSLDLSPHPQSLSLSPSLPSLSPLCRYLKYGSVLYNYGSLPQSERHHVFPTLSLSVCLPLSPLSPM